jgi:hypothetical protein
LAGGLASARGAVCSFLKKALGVILACCGCLVISLNLFCLWGFNLWFVSIGFLFLLVPIAIFIGWEVGYVIARAICFLALMGLVVVNFDPFGDFELAHVSHFLLLLETLPFAILFFRRACQVEEIEMRARG